MFSQKLGQGRNAEKDVVSSNVDSLRRAQPRAPRGGDLPPPSEQSNPPARGQALRSRWAVSVAVHSEMAGGLGPAWGQEKAWGEGGPSGRC